MSKYPEKVLNVRDFLMYDDLVELQGKDLVFYDEHHGTAHRLKDALLEDIQRLYSSLHSGKTIIIIL